MTHTHTHLSQHIAESIANSHIHAKCARVWQCQTHLCLSTTSFKGKRHVFGRVWMRSHCECDGIGYESKPPLFKRFRLEFGREDLRASFIATFLNSFPLQISSSSDFEIFFLFFLHLPLQNRGDRAFIILFFWWAILIWNRWPLQNPNNLFVNSCRLCKRMAWRCIEHIDLSTYANWLITQLGDSSLSLSLRSNAIQYFTWFSKLNQYSISWHVKRHNVVEWLISVAHLNLNIQNDETFRESISCWLMCGDVSGRASIRHWAIELSTTVCLLLGS